MEIIIKPFHKNLFSLGGILIKSPSVNEWMKEIQYLKFDLNDIKLFAIPNNRPNSVWGCLVVIEKQIHISDVGKHELCQKITHNLYIPEKSILFPPLSIYEVNTLFQNGLHIMHPEFGLVELTEELNIQSLISEPIMKSYYVTKPEPSVFIPKEIKQFQIKAIPNEEVLKNLDENIFPKKEKMKNDSLSLLEKGKLGFYKLLFKKNKPIGKDAVSSIDKTGIWEKLESLIKSLALKEPKWIDNMQQDFEDLEKRNQKEVDKLLDLLKSNPEEALKYAIPLDDVGSTRGGVNMKLDLTKRWFDFSLIGNNNTAHGSGAIDLGDNLQILRDQYNQTAQNLIREKQYHKAAFVYMKLLKNYYLAAQTLEDGHLYQEAATIYIKHGNNEQKAAECYEKGNMINDAISLYKELNQNEKVGDLYMNINNRKEAGVYFEKVVEEYKSRNQYVKASLIFKNKMNDTQRGQSLLLEGWRSSKDSSNCLNNYFSNIDGIKHLKQEIETISKNDLTYKNSQAFVQVIQKEYAKKNELSDYIKEIAYEVIAKQINITPDIVSELKGFNKNDKELAKDTLRFKINSNKIL